MGEIRLLSNSSTASTVSPKLTSAPVPLTVAVTPSAVWGPSTVSRVSPGTVLWQARLNSRT